MAVSSEKLTTFILEYANRGEFDRHELTEQVCKIAGYAFPQKVVMMVTALLVSGSIVRGDDGKIRLGTAETRSQRSSGREGENDQHWNDLVTELRKRIEQQERQIKQVTEAAKQGIQAAADKVEAIQKELDAAKSNTRIVEVQVKDGTKKIKSVKGVFHSAFEDILQLARNRENIFIYGPTGCGKTHICQQVAEALNLPFYFVSCTTGMSEGSLSGRLLPVGDRGTFEYVIGEFVKAYETGGVFLLDEMDAADPNVLLIINSALANGRMAVSNRPKKPYAVRHKDFVCIAAANTVGTGADRLYSGRNKLDAATLDRFQIGKIYMDYDPVVEEQLCPDAELREKLLVYRKGIRSHRLERSLSTRFLASAYKMKNDEKRPWDFARIEKSLFEGWREDERNKVRAYR